MTASSYLAFLQGAITTRTNAAERSFNMDLTSDAHTLMEAHTYLLHIHTVT